MTIFRDQNFGQSGFFIERSCPFEIFSSCLQPFLPLKTVLGLTTSWENSEKRPTTLSLFSNSRVEPFPISKTQKKEKLHEDKFVIRQHVFLVNPSSLDLPVLIVSACLHSFLHVQYGESVFCCIFAR